MKIPSFDELVEMAKKDPESLTHLRRDAAQEMIMSQPEEARARLQAQQNRIEYVIATSKNPNEVNIRLNSELMDKVELLKRFANNADEALKEKADVLDINGNFGA